MGYPVAMFTDAPGIGTHTYSVHARTRRCDHLSDATPIGVGPDGQIAAVLLPSNGETSARFGGDFPVSVVEQMGLRWVRLQRSCHARSTDSQRLCPDSCEP